MQLKLQIVSQIAQEILGDVQVSSVGMGATTKPGNNIHALKQRAGT